jgi:hypothetical protein
LRRITASIAAVFHLSHPPPPSYGAAGESAGQASIRVRALRRDKASKGSEHR